MTIKSSLMFAKSLIFPKTEKKSSARRGLFGATLCIGLSIVPLICVVSITNGMIDGMTERIIGLSSGHVQSYISNRYAGVISAASFVETSKELLKIDGVKVVFPEVDISAIATGKKSRIGVQIRGVQSDIFTGNKSFAKLFEVCEGTLEDFRANEKYAVIGKKMAADLALNSGDSFRIITTRIVNGKLVPKLTSLKIAAVVSSGYQELDQFWVFVPLETVYKNLSLESASYNVMIQSDDAFSPDLVRLQRDIKKYYGKYANVYRWDQIHSSEFENFSSTRVMLVFVMMMIVLVASVNISSAIVMLVMERRKEIAILKSIGGTPRGITFSFLLTGTACGAGGLFFGVPVGILLTLFSNQLVKLLENIINFVTKIANGSHITLMDPAYYLSEIPVEISASQIILIVVAVLLLSIIVSFIPAKNAGKEKPLELLRNV